jgi:hypothetical protein
LTVNWASNAPEKNIAASTKTLVLVNHDFIIK